MNRTIPGLLLAAGWLTLLLEGSSLLFFIVMIGISVCCAYEFVRMSMGGSLSLPEQVYLVLSIALPVFFSGGVEGVLTPGDGLVFSFLLIALYVIFRYARFTEPYQLMTRLGFGLLYIGFLAAYLVKLRYLPEGGAWIVLLTAITAASDTGAYLAGSRFGKRKLCPAISPKKTVEGAVGGVLSSVAAALIVEPILFDHINWMFIVIAAVILSCVGMFGDLIESVVKRGSGVKDSGSILRGHGGVLDRIDSILIAGPVFYYMLRIAGIA